MAVTTFGRILEFNEKVEDWIQYTEKLEYFAKDIGDANKNRAILLIVISPKAYKLLWRLVAPERLEDKSYTQLVEAMKKHHNPKLSEIVQQHTHCKFSGSRVSLSRHLCRSWEL